MGCKCSPTGLTGKRPEMSKSRRRVHKLSTWSSRNLKRGSGWGRGEVTAPANVGRQDQTPSSHHSFFFYLLRRLPLHSELSGTPEAQRHLLLVLLPRITGPDNGNKSKFGLLDDLWCTALCLCVHSGVFETTTCISPLHTYPPPLTICDLVQAQAVVNFIKLLAIIFVPTFFKIQTHHK